MLPLARAFDNVCAVFIALLPTLALTFAANALIGDSLFPVADIVAQASDPTPPPLDFRIEEPELVAESPVDAAVTTAMEIVFDNVDVEDSIFDHDEQCCPSRSRRLFHGLRWHHWMIP